MFYLLDSFAQCLPPFFHQGRFLTFYTKLIWKKCRDFFVKKITVETGALSIVEIWTFQSVLKSVS